MKRLIVTVLSAGAVLISGWLASHNNAVEVSADVQTELAPQKDWQISPISVTVENLPNNPEKTANSLGQVYFRLGSFDRDLSKYQLVRLPGLCVVGEI